MYYLLLISTLLLSCNVLANNGYVIRDSPHEYHITLDKSSINNTKDSISTQNWNLYGAYQGTVDCSLGDVSSDTFYYKADYLSGLTPGADGYTSLNEYIDVKVEIWIAGGRRALVTAPFNNESNNGTGSVYSCYSNTNGGTLNVAFQSGSQGKVTFRLRKPIINGIEINDLQVVEMFGRLGLGDGTFGSSPMTRVTIKSFILYVTETCTFNQGDVIEIEFNDLPSTGLDGNRFGKEVDLTLTCSGDRFDNNNTPMIGIGISGRGALFNPNYLATTKNSYNGDTISNLGIMFKQLNGDPLILKNFYSVNMRGSVGHWGFQAFPISDIGAEVDAGEFYATATIVTEFQ